MGPHPGYHSARLREYLEQHLQRFEGLPLADRHQLTHLFHALYHSRYAHKKYEGYSFLPQATYREWFGRTNNRDRFLLFIESYDWFEVEDGHQFGSPESYTKGYRLSSRVETIMDSYFNSLLQPSLQETTITKESGRTVRTPPSNAIHSAGKDGNPAKCTAWLRPVVELNPEAIYPALLYAKKLSDSRTFGDTVRPAPSPFSTCFDHMGAERLEKALSQLRELHDLCYNRLLPYGHIPQRYVESKSGRLYGAGINLQNVVRQVKHVALSGKNLIEYDFSNCHFTVLHQLALKAGIPCPVITSYLADKVAVRERIAGQLEIAIADAKQCLLCLIYGARLVPYYQNSIPELIGVEKATELFQDTLFTSLKEDISRAGQAVITGARRHKGRIVNAMGKSIAAGRKQSEILSHLLQGYEAVMLNIALEEAGDRMVVLQHDGWICEPGVDLPTIRQAIKRRLGLTVRIKQELDFSKSGPK